MRLRGTWLAPVAIAIWAAAGASCRRAPLAGDAATDAPAPDAPATDARTTVEAQPETMVDSTQAHDTPSEPPATDADADADADAGYVGPGADLRDDTSNGDAPADRSTAADGSADGFDSDAPTDMAPVVDAPTDMIAADAPPDTPAQDRTSADGSDVRPDEQPCGPAGLICAPYRCDVARGQCFTTCMTDDDCVNGRPCRASSCGFQTPGPCSSNNECASGFCAQGVCCSSACTRLCSSCTLAAQVGTCAPVPSGGQEPGGRCPAGNVCDGRGECVPSVCAVDTDCGRYHRCTGTRCVACSPTCISSADCTPPAICIDRNGCTICGVADAGTDRP